MDNRMNDRKPLFEMIDVPEKTMIRFDNDIRRLAKQGTTLDIMLKQIMKQYNDFNKDAVVLGILLGRMIEQNQQMILQKQKQKALEILMGL